MKKRFGQIAASYLILIKDDKILLSKRHNTGYHDGDYSLAAGHIEKDETAKENIVREALEEIGVKVTLQDLKLVHILHRPSDEDYEQKRMDFFWQAKNWKGFPKILEPEKCSELVWCPIAKLPKNTIPYVRQAIECTRKNIIYSEFGWKNKSK